jgi:hypothetical protein
MKKFLTLIIVFILTSCNSIMINRGLKRSGVFNLKSELYSIENDQKKIFFIPMKHIGRKEFYDDVANKIDSLQKLDYTVFYEGVNYGKDSLIRRKNLMKLRKIKGFFPQGNKGYIDTTTNIIAGKIKYNGKYKLINQPSYGKLKVDSLTSILADVSLAELITDFEKKNEKIILDKCDFSFSLKDENFKCKKVKKSLRKIFDREYAFGYRDKSLAERIAKSEKKKILVIYGSRHFWRLYTELKKIDKNFKLNFGLKKV